MTIINSIERRYKNLENYIKVSSINRPDAMGII